MPKRYRMTSIMGRSYLPLNFEKLLNMTLFALCHLQIITNQHQTLVQMYMIIRCRMSSIMDVIGPGLSELSALELENLPHLTLFKI